MIQERRPIHSMRPQHWLQCANSKVMFADESRLTIVEKEKFSPARNALLKVTSNLSQVWPTIDWYWIAATLIDGSAKVEHIAKVVRRTDVNVDVDADADKCLLSDQVIYS